MSLQYIIDGYNLIHNPLVAGARSNHQDPKEELLRLIKKKRLTGSAKNKVLIVFDGYSSDFKERNIDEPFTVIFSFDESADEKIKKLVEASSNPKTIVVVSDDKEIRFFARASGARVLSIEEFTGSVKKAADSNEKELVKPELNYTQIQKINQELKKIWLE
jgi:predicted RNA-binding protein with PIN domain